MKTEWRSFLLDFGAELDDGRVEVVSASRIRFLYAPAMDEIEPAEPVEPVETPFE